MPHVSFSGLLIVAAIAVSATLLVGVVPAIRVPAVVLEILAGIAVGPSGLGWVKIDLPIHILALFGLAFLLLLAGLEIDVERLRGHLLRLAGLGFALSLVLGLAVGVVFHAVGYVTSPLLIAIALSATSLGLVVPVLRDAQRSEYGVCLMILYSASIRVVGAS